VRKPGGNSQSLHVQSDNAGCAPARRSHRTAECTRLSSAAVGLQKTEALKEALELIAPGIQVMVRTHRMAGQESALIALVALKDTGSCDLVIDATAVPSVIVRLAAVALAYLKPLVWGLNSFRAVWVG